MWVSDATPETTCANCDAGPLGSHPHQILADCLDENEQSVKLALPICEKCLVYVGSSSFVEALVEKAFARDDRVLFYAGDQPIGVV